MNHYGARMLQHWKRHRPAEFADLESQGETQRFFTQLGERIVEAVRLRQEEIEQASPENEDYLAEVQRLTSARQRAEEEVLMPMLLVETGTNPPQQPEAHSTV